MPVRLPNGFFGIVPANTLTRAPEEQPEVVFELLSDSDVLADHSIAAHTFYACKAHIHGSITKVYVINPFLLQWTTIEANSTFEGLTWNSNECLKPPEFPWVRLNVPQISRVEDEDMSTEEYFRWYSAQE
jgi:hypothetical protein